MESSWGPIYDNTPRRTSSMYDPKRLRPSSSRNTLRFHFASTSSEASWSAADRVSAFADLELSKPTPGPSPEEASQLNYDIRDYTEQKRKLDASKAALQADLSQLESDREAFLRNTAILGEKRAQLAIETLAFEHEAAELEAWKFRLQQEKAEWETWMQTVTQEIAEGRALYEAEIARVDEGRARLIHDEAEQAALRAALTQEHTALETERAELARLRAEVSESRRTLERDRDELDARRMLLRDEQRQYERDRTQLTGQRELVDDQRARIQKEAHAAEQERLRMEREEQARRVEERKRQAAEEARRKREQQERLQREEEQRKWEEARRQEEARRKREEDERRKREEEERKREEEERRRKSGSQQQQQQQQQQSRPSFAGRSSPARPAPVANAHPHARAFAAYRACWDAIRAGRFALASVPWPVLVPVQRVEDLTRMRVSDFVLSQHHSAGVKPKKRVLDALLVWHPDQSYRVLEHVVESERDAVKEGMDVVVRHLNAIKELHSK